MASSPAKPRIGVVGTGWWSTQHHLPGLKSYDGCELAAIADPDVQKLETAGDAFGVARRFVDYHDLLALVDGVVVAVPHEHHYAIARDALDAGVHVMVEKPMTLASRDSWDLVSRAGANGLHLVCGYTFQFTRHARLVRDIVRSGRIGEVRLVAGVFASIVESYYRGRPDEYADAFEFALTGPAPATYSGTGGGQGFTQVTHPMGMVFWVTGLCATEVYAHMERHDLDVDLVDAIAFRLSGGAVGTMASTGSLRPGQDQQQELRYYGTDGLVVQDLIHGRTAAYFNDGTSVEPDDLAPDEIYPTYATARCLADLIRGEAENLAPGEPAAATVEFLEACYASAADGRPVRLTD
jgi:predicted dehydrogenase